MKITWLSIFLIIPLVHSQKACHGEWGIWEPWSSCPLNPSSSLLNVQRRVRVCVPTPEGCNVEEPYDCPGSYSEVKQCLLTSPSTTISYDLTTATSELTTTDDFGTCDSCEQLNIYLFGSDGYVDAASVLNRFTVNNCKYVQFICRPTTTSDTRSVSTVYNGDPEHRGVLSDSIACIGGKWISTITSETITSVSCIYDTPVTPDPTATTTEAAITTTTKLPGIDPNNPCMNCSYLVVKPPNPREEGSTYMEHVIDKCHSVEIFCSPLKDGQEVELLLEGATAGLSGLSVNRTFSCNGKSKWVDNETKKIVDSISCAIMSEDVTTDDTTMDTTSANTDETGETTIGTTDGTAETTEGNTSETGETTVANTGETGETTEANTGETGETTEANTEETGETTVANTGETGETTEANTGETGETTAANTGETGETTEANTGETGETTEANTGETGETTEANTGETTAANTEETDETTAANTGETGETTEANTEETGETTEANTEETGETTEANTGETGETTEANTGETGETTVANTGETGETTEANTGETGETTEANTGETTVANTGETGETTEANTEETGETTEANTGETGETTEANTEETGETTEANTGETGETTVANTEETGETTEANTGETGETTEGNTENTGEPGEGETTEMTSTREPETTVNYGLCNQCSKLLAKALQLPDTTNGMLVLDHYKSDKNICQVIDIECRPTSIGDVASLILDETNTVKSGTERLQLHLQCSSTGNWVYDDVIIKSASCLVKKAVGPIVTVPTLPTTPSTTIKTTTVRPGIDACSKCPKLIVDAIELKDSFTNGFTTLVSSTSGPCSAVHLTCEGNTKTDKLAFLMSSTALLQGEGKIQMNLTCNNMALWNTAAGIIVPNIGCGIVQIPVPQVTTIKPPLTITSTMATTTITEKVQCSMCENLQAVSPPSLGPNEDLGTLILDHYIHPTSDCRVVIIRCRGASNYDTLTLYFNGEEVMSAPYHVSGSLTCSSTGIWSRLGSELKNAACKIKRLTGQTPVTPVPTVIPITTTTAPGTIACSNCNRMFVTGVPESYSSGLLTMDTQLDKQGCVRIMLTCASPVIGGTVVMLNSDGTRLAENKDRINLFLTCNEKAQWLTSQSTIVPSLSCAHIPTAITTVTVRPVTNPVNPDCSTAVWAEWDEWSTCPTPCGSCGNIQRFRVCEKPSAECRCPGSAYDKQYCNTKVCLYPYAQEIGGSCCAGFRPTSDKGEFHCLQGN